MSRRATHLADKTAQLARGEPWVVHPTEVAKSTAAYKTDPEILLGCIIVSGTLDTAAVLKTDILLVCNVAISDGERAAYDEFRRVWQIPTEGERASVLTWATKIATATGMRHDGAFRWTTALTSEPDA